MTQTAHILTAQQIVLLRRELELLLQSPHFKNSKRYPRFIRKIVECTISGDLDELKERSLGHSVFDRTPDYDTGADPIVRITAGEVRKRLAQYYQAQGQEQAVQISLPVGTYVPEFHFLGDEDADQKGESVGARPQSQSSAPSQEADKAIAVATEHKSFPLEASWIAKALHNWFGRSFLRVSVLSSLATALLMAAGYFAIRQYQQSSNSALNTFWSPMTSGTGVVPFVIGRATLVMPGDSDPSLRAAFQGMKAKIAISDASAFSKICALVRTKAGNCTLKLSNQASISEMLQQPTVLIGLLNNEWSERLVGQLRFRPNSNVDAEGVTHEAWIWDTKNPGVRWGIDFGQRLDTVTKDYGLLARFDSEITEQPVILIGGLSALGTEGIGDFATDPRSMKLLESMAPRGKSFRNVEAVIETEVIGGKPGRARVVAVDFW